MEGRQGPAARGLGALAAAEAEREGGAKDRRCGAAEREGAPRIGDAGERIGRVARTGGAGKWRGRGFGWLRTCGLAGEAGGMAWRGWKKDGERPNGQGRTDYDAGLCALIWSVDPLMIGRTRTMVGGRTTVNFFF